MKQQTFVAIDLETTGKYPLGAEICEIAMIKFRGEEVLGRYETLIRPEKGMSPVAESIHGLSLDVLKTAPSMKDVINEVVDFIDGAPLLGHNLSFDLAFLAYEFDQCLGARWFERKEHFSPVNFCTSLLSISMNPKFTSHRLKHLAERFEIELKPNHRAMMDAEVCMKVFFKLIENKNLDLRQLSVVQNDDLSFKDFSVEELLKVKPEFKAMVEACENGEDFELMYSKGSQKNKWRTLHSKGLVMKTKNQSFFVGVDLNDVQTKRFMLDKIVDTKSI